ncbi:unnamed protein product [Rotaria sp. Silwood2]|nr:unnamed protein product [Rotaria sp. Silwood2]
MLLIIIYSSVLDCIGGSNVIAIELATTDLFFVSHFSKEPFPISIINRNDILYSFDPNDDLLFVTISSDSKQCKEICNKVLRGIITGLPTGWQCEQKGVLMCIEDKIQHEWIREGPEKKTKDTARTAIEHFYKD